MILGFRAGDRRGLGAKAVARGFESLEDRRLMAAAADVGLVSFNASNSDSVNTGAISPSISDDGRYEVFESGSTDVVSGVSLHYVNVFLRDRQANKTTCLSVDPSGANSGNGNSHYPIISANGRYVVFVSEATNLVSLDNPSNNPLQKDNIFVRDLASNTTTLVSVNASGTGPGDNSNSGNYGISSNPTISADGRYVAYQSDAVDLVPNDNNGRTDVFLRDLQARTTTLVSRASDGSGSGNSTSNEPVISADGSTIAYESLANNLDATFQASLFFEDYQVYAYKVATGVNSLVSYDTTGIQVGNDSSVFPSLSANGRMVAFQSWSTNLVTTRLNNSLSSPDVYVRDLSTGVTQLVSVNASGTASGDSSSFQPNISADGTHVVFTSLANDLVSNDHDGTDFPSKDVFVRDLNTGTTLLVSVNASGSDSGNSTSDLPNQTLVNPAQQSMGTISSDGRYVLFMSRASDIMAGYVKQNDSTYGYDIFLRDTVAGTTTLISHQRGSATLGGNRISAAATMTPSGQAVAFQSTSDNMVAKDTNAGVNQTDVFAWPAVGSGGGGGGSAVVVDPTGVQLVFDKRNKTLLRQVVVFFNGGLNRSKAINKAAYRLALPGKGGSFTAKNAKVLKIGAPSYDPKKLAVTLTISGGVTLKGKTAIQLRITGQGSKGLTDANGNLIDGNRDGAAGGDVVALLKNKSGTLA